MKLVIVNITMNVMKITQIHVFLRYFSNFLLLFDQYVSFSKRTSVLKEKLYGDAKDEIFIKFQEKKLEENLKLVMVNITINVMKYTQIHVFLRYFTNLKLVYTK